MTEMDIKKLLRYGERIILECKKAQNAVPKSVWETYSSFANTNGGTILLGIEEDLQEPDPLKRFSVTKIQDPSKIIRDFWNTINGDKVNVNILIDANVGTTEYNGETVIWIEVPPADYKQRPVYINGNPLKGTFKRTFEGDYHCTEEEIKAMLRDASDAGNDGSIGQAIIGLFVVVAVDLLLSNNVFRVILSHSLQMLVFRSSGIQCELGKSSVHHDRTILMVYLERILHNKYPPILWSSDQAAPFSRAAR